MKRRFLTLADVTEVLNISAAQAYVLLRSGELVGIQVGPRKIWRIEEAELEAYIQRMYAETRARTRVAVDGAEDEDGAGPDGVTGATGVNGVDDLSGADDGAAAPLGGDAAR